jgi:hypothetical protein
MTSLPIRELGLGHLGYYRASAHATEAVGCRILLPARVTAHQVGGCLGNLRNALEYRLPELLSHGRGRDQCSTLRWRIPGLQLVEKFGYCLFPFLRRAREIDLGPSAHMLAKERIQQRI